MPNDGVAAISHQVSNLDLNDDHGIPSAFAAYDSAPPAPPKLESKGIMATDITQQFSTAAKQLEMGQLVKDPFFTLFESVGALEIMDPKMDSGFLEPGETMEDEYDYSTVLLPEEVIGIIDQLLCHEMAWHMGHPLSQTIFTSLYIDRILSPAPFSLDATIFDRSESCSDEPLTLQVLRAYCVGLIKTCWYVNNRVKSEHFYEEEDFVTHTYNRNLLESIDHDVVIQFLETTTDLLSNSDIVAELKDALQSRLEFRAVFLKTVETVDSRSAAQTNALWNELLSFLPNLKDTKQLAKDVPQSFSVKLQRKLASTIPPRPIVQVSPDAAHAHLERLCQDGAVATEVLDYHGSHNLMTFVLLFQARKPQPSVYVRTLLQHYIFGDMIVLGCLSIRRILDDDLATTVLPADEMLDPDNDDIEVPSDPRFNMAVRMETFRQRAAQSYLDILRTICQNRCRIRRTLCHSIVDWDNLQLDSEELDVEFRLFTKEQAVVDRTVSNDPIFAFPLSSWAYFYKLRQMEWVVQLGFELEIYQMDELAGMYWYLVQLSKTRLRHLERMQSFVKRKYSDLRRSRMSQPGKNVPSEKDEQFVKAISFLNYSMLEATTNYGFADALSSLFTVLTRLNLIYIQPRPYNDASFRYELRMKPFLSIGLPEVVSYDDFTRRVQQEHESTLGLLTYATEAVAGAKKGYELMSKLSADDAFCQGSHDSWVKNIKDCLKACIFTGIVITSVKKAVGATGKDGVVKLKVEIPVTGKGYHDWWVVPKVVASS
ncbi:N-alpha-acetyltransferase 35, NatC auxiliary subunit [Phlyctema vagabunda]|uniref:N-alpha-acetyltransferase 35, NatC auxiliary subunit n=1 Tax=Phlyctema vagabunda TaxID=108571 RepID=A0ABR4P5V8_9HELO